MKTCALLTICTSIATNTWFGVLGNNSLWSFVNDLFPFIATHCGTSMRVVLVLVYIDQAAVALFILMRTHHFFDLVPTAQINQYLYKGLVGTISVITALFVLASLVTPNSAFQVMIYDDREYRQCELAFATGSETLMTVIFPWLAISQQVIQLFVLAICVKKLFDFRKYCDKPSLSQYFSGKPVKSHIVNRFLFASIGYFGLLSMDIVCCGHCNQSVGHCVFV